MQPLIIDIYHGDPIADLNKTKEFGILGVIHKASQGGASVDPRYASRRKMATDLGMLWGAYHFFDFSASPKEQAHHFLSVAQPDNNTLVALDWEPVNGRSPSATLAREFLEEIEAKLGRKAVVYSGNSAKEEIHGKDAYFGSHRLWLAEYGSVHRVQASWEYPWLWQNNGDAMGPGPHSIPGIEGHCDNNTIIPPMTVERLKSEWSGAPQSVPVANGDPGIVPPLPANGDPGIVPPLPTSGYWYDPIERVIKKIENLV